MKTVWKYTLGYGVNKIDVPRNPQWLHVGHQNGTMMVWAAVDTASLMQEYQVEVVNTGMEIPTEFRRFYLGTIQDGVNVKHVFILRGQ